MLDFKPMTCRKCDRVNPWVFFAPVDLGETATCVCLTCAQSRGWVNRDGNLKEGVTL